jgi:hypothetical protein
MRRGSGYDSGLQQVARGGVFEDCVSWKIAHGGMGNAPVQRVALR